jgi:hypothetical protein
MKIFNIMLDVLGCQMKRLEKIIESCLAAGDHNEDVLIPRMIIEKGLEVLIPGTGYRILIKPADDWEEGSRTEALDFKGYGEYNGHEIFNIDPSPKRGKNPVGLGSFAFWVCTVLSNIQDYVE